VQSLIDGACHRTSLSAAAFLLTKSKGDTSTSTPRRRLVARWSGGAAVARLVAGARSPLLTIHHDLDCTFYRAAACGARAVRSVFTQHSLGLALVMVSCLPSEPICCSPIQFSPRLVCHRNTAG